MGKRVRKHPGVKFSNWTPDDITKVETLYHGGMLHKDIAIQLGRTHKSVGSQIARLRRLAAIATKLDYDEDTNNYIVWICDEIVHQKVNWYKLLEQANVPYQRFYNYRKRKAEPRLTDVENLLKLLGYRFDLVPIKKGAHNGSMGKDG